MTACFIHIPKTGGVSIQTALELQQFRSRVSIRGRRRYSGLITFGHQLVGRLIHARYVPRDMFLFSFCRNPYDRAVSLWAHYRREYEPDMTFVGFCHRLRRLSWRIRSPQVTWLRGIKLDFLGRFETLEADFARLCDVLGVQRRALPHLNAGSRSPWCGGYYDDELQAIIRRQYAPDFERFGYDDDHLPD
jgi:hypothetical protein